MQSTKEKILHGNHCRSLLKKQVRRIIFNCAHEEKLFPLFNNLFKQFCLDFCRIESYKKMAYCVNSSSLLIWIEPIPHFLQVMLITILIASLQALRFEVRFFDNFKDFKSQLMHCCNFLIYQSLHTVYTSLSNCYCNKHYQTSVNGLFVVLYPGYLKVTSAKKTTLCHKVTLYV